ncbi:MAG: phosphoribosylglycinamide formyltransferase, partial [Gemmatimonadetes bacterium]|nr:phosphoribosylglycinamide formyltransferase [Gemmatimonadota bacterium]
MSYRVAVCVSGRGSNLAALIDGLRDEPGAEVALVLSNRATAGGLERARAAGIPAEVFDDPADPTEWITRCGRRDVDLIVLAGYLKLVPAQVVSRYHGRLLNIHPALLPAFGGQGYYGERVHAAVLERGCWYSGCTVHYVDDEYDHGRIVLQRAVRVARDDTVE